MSDKQGRRQAFVYVVDTRVGYHRYVPVEGIGECWEHFATLVSDLERGKARALLVAGIELLYADTCTIWIEKLIATVKQ
jgi:hypothetical protein